MSPSLPQQEISHSSPTRAPLTLRSDKHPLEILYNVWKKYRSEEKEKAARIHPKLKSTLEDTWCPQAIPCLAQSSKAALAAIMPRFVDMNIVPTNEFMIAWKQALMDKLAHFTPKELLDNLEAFARFPAIADRQLTETEKSIAPLIETFITPLLSKYTQSQLARILPAFAEMQTPPSEALITAWNTALKPKIGRFTPVDCVYNIEALASFAILKTGKMTDIEMRSARWITFFLIENTDKVPLHYTGRLAFAARIFNQSGITTVNFNHPPFIEAAAMKQNSPAATPSSVTQNTAHMGTGTRGI